MQKFLAMPISENNCTFGVQPFYDWEEDIENGRYDKLTNETFDTWKDYTIYVCNLATNTSCRSAFFDKALEHNPDMLVIQDINAVFDVMGKLGGELVEIDGYFNITLEALQEKQNANK